MKRVLAIFEEISAIPRGSGNTAAISDYCAKFAQNRGFEAVQDDFHNCLIRVPATPGREEHPTLILQGHLDMVCEKEAGSTHDFETDGLKLIYQGDQLTADGTTLGGDNGIALAIGLALLEQKDLSHPPLEIFFTADEETGMDGAIGFDPALLKGRLLLNLDSEEEGVMIVSSAGGRNISARIPLQWEPCQGQVYQIKVDGLKGGHSGAEIHQGRANANMILGKILSGLNCRLIAINGGHKANVIPGEATALAVIDHPIDGGDLTALFRREYGDRDPDLTVTVSTATAEQMMAKECSERVIALLASLPDGVQKWSEEMEGLVETSLNCGILRTEQEELFLLTSLRSMKNAERDTLAERVLALCEKCGISAQSDGEYPAWEYRANSPLRETVAKAWEALSGKKAKAIALHAGLECGLFDKKLPGLDAVSIGPNMKDIHTPRETLSLSSSERVWQWVKKIIEEL